MLLPPTTSGILRGSSILVHCTQKNAQGTPQPGASANLTVDDLGPTGSSTPINVLSLPNGMTWQSPSYVYTLITSPSLFALGHYYRVVGAWNDGSVSTSYFYVKK